MHQLKSLSANVIKNVVSLEIVSIIAFMVLVHQSYDTCHESGKYKI